MTYLSDDSVMEIITQKRENFYNEYKQAQEAMERGDRERAALYYLVAREDAEHLVKITESVEDYENLANLCEALDSLRNLDFDELKDENFALRAGSLWLGLFEKTRLSKYRRRVEEMGILEKDTLDYRDLTNYIKRDPKELAKYAVSLEQYDVLENDEGEFMIGIHSVPEGDETKAYFFCDGSAHAILCKGPYRVIVCDFLHPQIRKKISSVDRILCYEDNNPDENKVEYIAKVVPFVGIGNIAKRLLTRLGK